MPEIPLSLLNAVAQVLVGAGAFLAGAAKVVALLRQARQATASRP